jgi:hypothetical protein
MIQHTNSSIASSWSVARLNQRRVATGAPGHLKCGSPSLLDLLVRFGVGRSGFRMRHIRSSLTDWVMRICDANLFASRDTVKSFIPRARFEERNLGPVNSTAACFRCESLSWCTLGAL